MLSAPNSYPHPKVLHPNSYPHLKALHTQYLSSPRGYPHPFVNCTKIFCAVHIN